ncbi:MAG: hypothetical protein V4670_05315 [Bacteroidota bacterium]
MKKIACLIICLVFLSCDKKEKVIPKKEKQFEMYEMSEMAMLMEQIYVNNQRLKERITRKEYLGNFPQHFLEIHSAVMTDKQENDSFFKKNAASYIHYQKMIYQDPQKAKENFNSSIDVCIKCHEVKCTGPIQRIKKLYIK